MITAEQARVIMLCDNRPCVDDMQEVYTWIKQRAERGYSNTWITEIRLSASQIQELISNGYKVVIDNTKDYKISWENETSATN